MAAQIATVEVVPPSITSGTSILIPVTQVRIFCACAWGLVTLVVIHLVRLQVTFLNSFERRAATDAPYLDRLYYQFPLDKRAQYRLTIGAHVRNTEMAWIPSVYRSDVLDFFGTAGTAGVYNKALGEGIGVNWRQPVAPGNPAWLAALNTVVSGSAGNSATSSCPSGCRSGNSGADSAFGVFNAKSGINTLVQLG